MKYSGIYKALVVDGNDTENRGRAKVRVKGIHDGLPDSALPWAACHSFAAVAQGGSSCVLNKGAKVSVRFLEGDINYPVWAGGVIESKSDLPKNHKAGRYVIYENSDSSVVITANDDLGDIEIKVDGFNTTLKTMINAALSHTHMTPAGVSGNSGSGIPPLLPIDFNGGNLQ